ncbi:MAG: type II secretion system F family protein [Rickettsiales bacterium]
MASPLIISIIAALLVFVGYLAMDIAISRRQRVTNLRSRVATQGAGGGVMDEDPVELDQSLSGGGSVAEGILKMTGMNTEKAIADIKPMMVQAGITNNDAPLYFLLYNRFIRWILVFVGIVLATGPGDELLNGILGLIVGGIGFFGAELYVKNKRQKREKVLIRAFPDTLDLLVVCVESGLALDASLARVCGELGHAYPEITKELNQTRLELALLNDRSQALLNLAERTNLVPFRSLVAALIQTEKFGTSLTDTLRVLSEDYRMTRLMIAEEKAGKLPALMTIPLICLLLPAFFLIVLGPPFIRVIDQGGLFGNQN